MRLLDPDFQYVPSARTDVAATWRKFGFRPTTETERRKKRARPASAKASTTRLQSADPNAARERRRQALGLKLAVGD